jgi:cell fate (sporulation/competence/biofilm development) regulator YlbF (YheA/YmcA/DUF963 family)
MLTEEIQNTARLLGESLHALPPSQTYLKTQADCVANPSAADLEQRMFAMYEDLIARQQRGEELQPSEIDAFNSLKRQVFQHPLISEREAALALVKRHFSEIAEEINLPLGMEFPTLAQG